MAVHSIGPHVFNVMRGTPRPITEHVEVLSRPNVDGIQIRGLGLRGDPFLLSTTQDVATLEDGWQTISTYVALVRGNPVVLIHNNVDFFAQQGWLAVVRSVTPERVVRTSAIAGNLVAGSQAVVYARWLLQFVGD